MGTEHILKHYHRLVCKADIAREKALSLLRAEGVPSERQKEIMESDDPKAAYIKYKKG